MRLAYSMTITKNLTSWRQVPGGINAVAILHHTVSSSTVATHSHTISITWWCCRSVRRTGLQHCSGTTQQPNFVAPAGVPSYWRLTVMQTVRSYQQLLPYLKHPGCAVEC